MYNKASYTNRHYQYPYQGIYTTIGAVTRIRTRDFFYWINLHVGLFVLLTEEISENRFIVSF